MNRYVLMSFDVEEFDMPLEYHYPIALQEQFEIGKKGLDALLPLLSNPLMRTTLFTTGRFAEAYPAAIQSLCGQHEIASHTYNHSLFQEQDLLYSKQVLEKIVSKPVHGLRMPRMRMRSAQQTLNAGYCYDASVHPTWIPGNYNNLHLPRTFYYEDALLRIPASVSPNLRIPLFWLSFKNFPYSYYVHLAKKTLLKDGYLSLYFHPWEFTNVKDFGIPKFTSRLCGPLLVERLEQLAQMLFNEAEFIHMMEFAELHTVK
jgi:peptidoglycan/xylan/chitin deacetylase (PgdA/CDA1 family)